MASNSTQMAGLVAVARDASVRIQFADIIKAFYGGSPYQHSFDQKPGKAIQSINGWVKARSNGRIQRLLPKGEL